jgi:hypothetical protein
MSVGKGVANPWTWTNETQIKTPNRYVNAPTHPRKNIKWPFRQATPEAKRSVKNYIFHFTKYSLFYIEILVKHCL